MAGIFRSPTGIGEGARLMAAALDDLGYAVGLVDIGRSPPRDAPTLVTAASASTADVGGPLILHANPPLMQRALYRFRAQLPGRRIIAYWAWELPVLPRAWHTVLDLPHEIWVPSTFVAAAVAAVPTATPVRVMPHPVRLSLDSAVPMNLAAAAGRCMFLVMFSDGSGFERKNPLAAVRAFRQAFGDRRDVVLVLKYQILAARRSLIDQRLRDAVAGAQNIVIMEDALTSTERDGLVARADVVVSLHRSEGFGLTLAEAMLAGKPVIATNWSGNLDFMTVQTGALIRCELTPVHDPGGPYDGIESVWAEPDLAHAAAEMARLTDPDQRRRLGAAARQASATLFHPAAYAERIVKVLGPPPPNR
jgi:glycosyltransferase involved in cell wall biosynthesis